MGYPAYLESLNPRQREAVLHEGSPLLILAGAGSGKTRVITTKIAWLVGEKGMDPRSILAVTFTNRAAAEMRERVSQLAPRGEEVMIRTFHSFGSWLLRRNSHLLGLSSRYSIYDDDDALSLLSSLTEGKNRRELGQYARWISRAKDYVLAPGDDLDSISYDPEFPAIYKAYEDKLRELGNADFGDLILRSVELLRDNPEVRRRIHQRFKVVLVDEYQDSNVGQYELLKLLAGEDTYVCVVGDDDQSIYRFRGAEVKNILTFPDSFPGTAIVRLEQNYRSTDKILAIASEVVSHNSGRLGKTLWTEKTGGNKAVLVHLDTQDQEAEYCAELLKDGHLTGTAILYRTNAQSLPFETLFARKRIPYRLVGSRRFYDREEVKDVLAYLGLLNNPSDEVAFRRIINKPKRALGPAAVEKILACQPPEGPDMWEACRRAVGELSGKAAAGLKSFLDLKAFMDQTLTLRPLHEFIDQLIQATGLLDVYADKDEVAAQAKRENLNQIINAAGNYSDGAEGLTALLEDMTLDNSLTEGGGDAPDGVTLITMHNTKGLEFDRVIITGMDDGLFPGTRDETDEELEEERRIFYVSLTRAREELYLTTCRRRLLWGRWQSFIPSLFIREIPREFLEEQGASRSGSSGGAGEWPPGTGVYHDDYGPGVVVKQWHNGHELLVMVKFESGRTAQFLPKYTPLEKIAYDAF